MKKKILSIASLLIFTISLCAPVSADETRYQYDFNFPYGTFSLANFRASLRGLHQMDLMPLRPLAKLEVDPMEYTADAAAQAEYSGTGVTITSDNANEEKGDYSLKAVTDGTSNRSFGRTYASIDLSVFPSLTLWERSSQTSDTFQFYIEDSGGDASYWDITSNGSADTWQQDTIDLSSPDSNSGTAADLSDVAEYGFRHLTASTNYYFDQIFAICGMNIVVKGTDLGSYYKNVYVGNQPLESDAQVSPTLTAPSANPRIDILTIDSSGTLAWITGTEASSPSVPWSSLTVNKIPIALVYCKTTMTKVLAYEDKDTDSNQGYIYADVRPFVKLGVTAFTGLTDAPTSITSDQYLKGNSGGTALEFGTISQTFTGLTDTPSSYSSQALKWIRVNTGATALEFFTPTFLILNDTPSSYSSKGGFFAKVNSGENAIEFVEIIEGNYFSTDETDNSLQNVYGPDSAPSTASASYQKIWEVKMPMGGTVDLTFTVTSQGDQTVYARSYLNGVAVGTEASSPNSSTPSTRTEDISISQNDFLQIYAKGSGAYTANLTAIAVRSTNFTDIKETYP